MGGQDGARATEHVALFGEVIIGLLFVIVMTDHRGDMLDDDTNHDAVRIFVTADSATRGAGSNSRCSELAKRMAIFKGKSMNFARSFLLVLFISMVGASASMGAGIPSGEWRRAPASSSTSSDVPTAASVASPVRRLVADTTSTVTYYGAPYYAEDSHFGRGPNESALSAAINDWWVMYQQYWGVNSSNCSYWDVPTGDGPTTGTFVLMYIRGSGCWGGPSGVYGSPLPYDPGKNAGDGAGCDGGEGHDGGGGGSGSGGNGASSDSSCADSKGAPMAGDPINTSTGNKYLQDDDYTADPWLTFRRFYNSMASVVSSAMGSDWRHSFDRSLQLSNASSTPETTLPPNVAVMFRPDGKQETFTKTNGVWVTDPDITDALTESDDSQGNPTSYTVFIAALRHYETYSTSGLLQSVTDETGNGITLTYSTTLTAPAVAPAAGLLLTVTDPQGRQLNFTYDSTSHVHQVTLPDGGTLTYVFSSVEPSGGFQWRRIGSRIAELYNLKGRSA